METGHWDILTFNIPLGKAFLLLLFIYIKILYIYNDFKEIV